MSSTCKSAETKQCCAFCRQEPGLSIPHGSSESQPESSRAGVLESALASEASPSSIQQPCGSHSHARRRASYTGIDLAAKRAVEEEVDLADCHTEDEEEAQEAAKRVGTDLDRQLMGEAPLFVSIILIA